LDTKAIITDTYSGRTARYLAAYRGAIPVYAICYHEQSTRLLALSYGVYPIFQEGKGNTQQYFIQALQDLLTKGLVEREDAVCYLSGSFGEGFGTTFLEVNQVNKILESRKQYLLPNF
jgi:pyruvate kinase